jgi:DNA-binding PadR family transcriptional regulator
MHRHKFGGHGWGRFLFGDDGHEHRGEREERGEHRGMRGGGRGFIDRIREAHDRHHHGGGRSRLGRFFDHGDLRLVLLALIAEKPSHGYELIKAIEEKAGGAYSPSPGVIYPTLTLLEEQGFVTVSTTEGSKKLSTITPEGTAYLEANRQSVDAIFARIGEAGGGRHGLRPQVLRAMGNLKLALRLRLSRGSVSEAEAAKIAAILDAAALEIEKL